MSDLGQAETFSCSTTSNWALLMEGQMRGQCESDTQSDVYVQIDGIGWPSNFFKQFDAFDSHAGFVLQCLNYNRLNKNEYKQGAYMNLGLFYVDGTLGSFIDYANKSYCLLVGAGIMGAGLSFQAASLHIIEPQRE